MPVDVIVGGAGPAGLAAALHAARAGLSVAVFDPRPTPVDKACGEGLMPGAVRELDELGVAAAGTPFRGIRYVDGPTSAEAYFRRGPGLGVRRTQLQEALVAALGEFGVEVAPIRIDDISQDARSVTAGGVTARYLIAADGLHSAARRRLGLEIGARCGDSPRWGQRQHFEMTPWTDLVEVHWAHDREAYVTPVGVGLVGVAVLGSTRGPYGELLEAFPELVRRLSGAVAASTVRGAGPLRQRVRSRVAGRVLLVGDAAGYVDALTGEGIAVSLACARAAVECIVADRPEHYEQRWHTLSRRYRTITETLLWARRRPVIARQITPMAARLPAAFGALVDQLAR